MKTIFITGGSGTIGREIVRQASSSGFKHIFFTFFKRETESIEFAQTIKSQYGVQCTSIQCDVTDYHLVSRAVDQVVSTAGTIDAVVNNVGVMNNKLWLFMSENEWDSVIDINLKGTFNVIKAAARHMVRQRAGRIVNVSSVAGRLGAVGQVNYAASKSGLLGLTKTAAQEFEKYNIQTFAILPGMVESELTSTFLPGSKKKMLEAIPLGRFAKPKEVADAVIAVATGQLQLVNGEELIIDGGLTLCNETYS